MVKTRFVKKDVIPFLKKNWFIFFAVLVYVFFTFYYMGPSVTSCSNTVYGFGDNTAGPIWLASLPEKQGIIGSYTNMTNAPFGDNLNSPIGYSLIAQTVLIKTTMSIAGPICGYNIANMLGFMLSALVMFGFIYAVTKNRWIALFSGYAVTFVPYYQMKTGNHFSFGFQAIFIGLIWLFYRLLKYKKKRDAISLGILFAIAVYFDPYYSLLAATVVLPLGIVWLAINKKIFTKRFWHKEPNSINIKRQFRLLLVSIGIAVILIAPLIYIFSTQGRQISANVSASRGNVLAEAQACSNWPHEYLVPFVLNPIIKGVIGNDRYINTENSLRDGFSCGLAEDTVGLSLTLVLIVILGIAVIIWEKLNKRKTKLSYYLHFEPKILIYGLIAIATFSVLVAFPPLIFHNIIPTPSYELLQITSTWRTLTRIFVIVNIAIVALAAIFLTYFYKHFHLKKYPRLAFIIFVLLFLVVIVEYQSFAPFSGNKLSTFNYDKDVPPQYTWLKGQSDLKTIAEYPLERSGGEGNSMAYYLTMQVVHKKKLFNGAISYSDQELMKTGLKNLFDPQTVPVLKGMGVDAVVVHGVEKSELEKIPNIKVIYSAPQVYFNILGSSPLVKNDIVNVLSLKNVSMRQYVISLGNGFARNATIIKSAVDWQYEAVSGSVLNIQTLTGEKLNAPQDICFDIKMSIPSDVALLEPKIDGSASSNFPLDGTYKTVKVNAKSNVVLINSTGNNMRLTNIGCE